MQKIKVLEMLGSAGFSGARKYLFDHISHMDREQFSFDILSKDSGFKDLDEFEKCNCGLQLYNCTSKENPVDFKHQLENIFKNGYDVFHLHTSFWTGLSMEQCAMKAGIRKVIIHSHSSSIGIQNSEKYKSRVLEHEYYRTHLSLEDATHFCACSQKAADWLYGPQIPNEKITILRNGIDVPLFIFNPISRNKFRRALDLQGKFVIAFSGIIKYAKNPFFLLKVFKRLYNKNPNARLLLIGEIRESDNLNIGQTIIDFGLQKAVIITGLVNNVYDYLQASDVFVLPSFFEGLPISAIEAQTSGLKCLVSDAVTRECKITDNIKFLPLDAEEWVNEIMTYSDGYERKNMAQEIYDENYDIRQTANKLARLYMQ